MVGIVDQIADLWNAASAKEKREIRALIEQEKISTPEKKVIRAQAEAVLAFLNQKTGKKYRMVDTHLDMITQRLKSGIEVEQLKAIVANRVRAWANDPKTREWLRPATLFSREKCEQYLGEIGSD